MQTTYARFYKFFYKEVLSPEQLLKYFGWFPINRNILVVNTEFLNQASACIPTTGIQLFWNTALEYFTNLYFHIIVDGWWIACNVQIFILMVCIGMIILKKRKFFDRFIFSFIYLLLLQFARIFVQLYYI